MGRIRRGGYEFLWYVADHVPVHIHVTKNGRLICKWAIFEERVISGTANRKVLRLIKTLKAEGAFHELEKLK